MSKRPWVNIYWAWVFISRVKKIQSKRHFNFFFSFKMLIYPFHGCCVHGWPFAYQYQTSSLKVNKA
jgi:hypothetical protein